VISICWPAWLARAPSLVAESLARVPNPLASWLTPGPPAPAEAVAARLARALMPEEAEDPPPSWLRNDQVLSFRRALAAVRRHRGALLADGVGTGKTFIALAVARAIEPDRAAHAIVPAVLRNQWNEAARRAGVSIRIHTHETLSRGRAPPPTGGAVIIDESHRFRTACTRRYDTLAPWCAGRCGILLSATPVVNRLADLRNQLGLLVRDDALSWTGVPSLRGALDIRAPGAIATLVITGEDRSGLLPARHELAWRPAASGSLTALVHGVNRLALSTDSPTAELFRVVLLRAAASSPAAALTTLRRYGALLRHARDAGSSGRPLSRQTIRRFVGADADQLVLWPLVAEPGARVEVVVEDLETVTALERLASHACAEPDPKATALAELIRDRKPTLVFATAMATVPYLRNRLAQPGIAWCTGAGAGLDRGAAPRETVLDWFRRRTPPGDGLLRRPTVLLSTDVAAEGLDLPLVERVVHYDLPWTSVRLDQRSGRALRLGSANASVEVVRFDPPAELASLLRQESILEVKAGLPSLIGLDQRPDAPWRVRARLAASWEGHVTAEGLAVVRGTASGMVAGLRMGFADGSAREFVLAKTAGGWTDDPGTIAGLLEPARSGHAESQSPSRSMLKSGLRALSGRVAEVLRAANGARLGVAPRSKAVRALQRRFRSLAGCAARTRHRARLSRLDQGIRHLRRGLTSGEERRVEGWVTLSDAELFERLLALPPEPELPAPSSIALTALLLVEPGLPDG
jgi:superfamily II DNA or RNA helicase